MLSFRVPQARKVKMEVKVTLEKMETKVTKVTQDTLEQMVER